MDTSETYIKMCEKAEEIQPKAKPLFRNGDKFQVTPDASFWIQMDVCSTNWQIIWLPRQDQLQEMIGGDKYDLVSGLVGFLYVVSQGEMERSSEYASQFQSMEQLWLAAVMDWKYNKQWNGEGWVKGEHI